MEKHFFYLDYEGLLVVTNKGTLRRIKTPFKALSLIDVGEILNGEVYVITSVSYGPSGIMVYGFKGQFYYYYFFVILD